MPLRENFRQRRTAQGEENLKLELDMRLAMAISGEKFWQPGDSKSRVFK
jgi:hypothetical protein